MDDILAFPLVIYSITMFVNYAVWLAKHNSDRALTQEEIDEVVRKEFDAQFEEWKDYLY